MIALLFAEVLVLTQAPGLTAPEVERDVTIPIELALGGLGRLESRSATGFSEVRVQTSARAEVVERLQRVSLPPGIQSQLGPPAMSPVAWMRYTVTSDRHSVVELRTVQDWQLRRALLMVPGVADVASCGGRVERIHVDVDPARLAAYKVRLADIVGSDPDLMLDAGRGLRLRDVAQIAQGFAPPRCLAWLGGREVVVGVVQPRIGSPADLALAVRARLQSAAPPPGIIVQPFAPVQELTLRLPEPIKTDEMPRLAAAIERAVGSPALIEMGALDDQEESVREVRVFLSTKADVRKNLPPLGEVVAPGDPVVRITGPDLAVLDELAVKAGGKTVPRVPHLSIEPDRAALARLGLSAGDVLLHVEAACAGHPVGQVRRGERRIEAVVRLRDACKDLPTLRIGAVPLATVARLRQDSVPAEIRRAGGIRFVEIRGRRPALPLPAGYAIVIPSAP